MIFGTLARGDPGRAALVHMVYTSYMDVYFAYVKMCEPFFYGFYIFQKLETLPHETKILSVGRLFKNHTKCI